MIRTMYISSKVIQLGNEVCLSHTQQIIYRHKHEHNFSLSLSAWACVCTCQLVCVCVCVCLCVCVCVCVCVGSLSLSIDACLYPPARVCMWYRAAGGR
jgi:hypothetical protein